MRCFDSIRKLKWLIIWDGGSMSLCMKTSHKSFFIFILVDICACAAVAAAGVCPCIPWNTQDLWQKINMYSQIYNYVSIFLLYCANMAHRPNTTTNSGNPRRNEAQKGRDHHLSCPWLHPVTPIFHHIEWGRTRSAERGRGSSRGRAPGTGHPWAVTNARHAIDYGYDMYD